MPQFRRQRPALAPLPGRALSAGLRPARPATLIRMDRVWQSAPVAALCIMQDAQGRLQVQGNEAVARWTTSLGLGAADWQVLAARWWPATAAATGRDEIGPECCGVSVKRVALDGGAVLLWLQPENVDKALAMVQRNADVLDRALALAGISVWRIDQRTQRVHFNAIGFQVVGMDEDPAGIPVQAMRDTIHPDDQAAVVRAAEEAMASDRVIDVVARYRNPDGSWRTLLTRRVAERDAAGQVVGLAGISLDLSAQFAERQRAETLIEHTRLAAEAIGVGFWSRNVDAGEARWDEQMYRIHRRDPALGPPGFDNWIGQHVHPQDQAWMAELHRRASADWAPVVDAMFRVPDDRNGDGGERWVQTWTRRLLRNGQRLAFGMHMDVTDRQRAQALLQRERERTQFAIEAAEVGVWERGLDGRGAFWNDAMYRLRGLAPSDPRPIETLGEVCAHPDDLVELNRLVRRHLEDGTPYRFEFRVRLPDGTQRWLVTHGCAMRDADGRLLGMAGINLDITERKQTDALRQQKNIAEQAARDQSAFLARVSHELRTPMNAVLGFTQLLGDDSAELPSPRQRERLQRIQDAGMQMMALVDDLLDLASIEADNAAGTETLAISALLPQVLDGWRLRAQQQAVALRSGTLAGSVRADRRRLSQLLSHLVGHALRRQPNGGWVEIGSRVDNAAADGTAQLCLTVHDGGPPYSDAERETLFELFQRQGVARRSGEGSGIGMALAWRLARALGGQVLLCSRPPAADAADAADGADAPAAATELCLLLPAEVAAAAAPVPPLLRALATSPPLHVLCVEDNPVNLLLVRELLALRPGVRLREASDGHSGITMALAEPPDVLLLDLQLPDIGGLDVLRRLRAEPALARCVWVALSANAMPDHIAEARAAGFDDYWTKPIDFPQFLAGIDRLAARGA